MKGAIPTREMACAVLATLLCALAGAADDKVVPLPGTEPLTVEGDLSAAMRAGFDRFLSRELEESVGKRAELWKRDFSSAEKYNASVAENRERFGRMIGLVDERVPIKDLELVGTLGSPAKIAENDRVEVFKVRWPVLEGVYGEGLLLEPKWPTGPPASRASDRRRAGRAASSRIRSSRGGWPAPAAASSCPRSSTVATPTRAIRGSR